MSNRLKTWQFGIDNNRLVGLVLDNKKTATTSLYNLYDIPKINEKSILTYDNQKYACIVETKNVIITEFKNMTWDLAKLEGENNSLEEWKNDHITYFNIIDKNFNEDTKVVFEIFEVIKKIDKKLSLYVPKICDYWYEAKLQKDPDTMNYNAGYEVSYCGYHYDTGCIDFPKENWEKIYNKRRKENNYFAYVMDNELNQFIGYVNYQYNKKDDRYECGIVIESKYRGKGYAYESLRLLCDEARKNNIKSLYDSFELDRSNALEVFESVGFKVIKNQIWRKFNKEVKGVLVKIEL